MKKFNGLILISMFLFLGNTLNANVLKLQKIDEERPTKLQKIDIIDPDKSTKKHEVFKKLPLKNYKYLTYHKEYFKYSLLKRDKAIYKNIMHKLDVDKVVLKNMFLSADTYKSTLLSAFGLDYIYHKPNYAYNFYKLFKEKKIDGIYWIRYVDFLLVTGNVNKAYNEIKDMRCLSYLPIKNICYYYKGVLKYIISGNNQNTPLQTATTNGVKKAQYIYNKKLEKLKDTTNFYQDTNFKGRYGNKKQ